MIEEIIDKETNMKNEVVAAYGEVLRKLKVTHSAEKLDKKTAHLPLEAADMPVAHQENTYKNLSNLKQIFLTSLDNLEEMLLTEKRKLSSFESEVLEKTRAWKIEEQNYISKRDSQREKDQDRYEAAQREEEKEYIHQRNLQREKDRHQYEISRRDLDNTLKEHEEKMLAREEECRRIKEKETWVLAREQEFYLLKQKVEQFPEEMRQALQKTEKMLTENLALKYEYEAKLSKMEMEAERMSHQQAIAALEAKIAHLESLKYSFNKLAFNSMDTVI